MKMEMNISLQQNDCFKNVSPNIQMCRAAHVSPLFSGFTFRFWQCRVPSKELTPEAGHTEGLW